MKEIATAALAALCLAVVGCAAPGTPGNGFGASYTPVVDMKGVDPARYSQDLAECRGYAAQVDAGGNAVAGAVIGGALMAALSGAAGNRSYWNQRYAATGAVAGGASAGGASLAHQRNIIGRCMVGRGYNVLG